MRSPAASTSARRCSGSATSPAIATTSSRPDDGALERSRSASVDDEPPPALDERADERETEAARGAGDDADRHPLRAVPPARRAGDDAVVVEPQERDHVLDVFIGLDPAGAEARRPGKTGW